MATGLNVEVLFLFFVVNSCFV